jgi:hypothetical protein
MSPRRFSRGSSPSPSATRSSTSRRPAFSPSRSTSPPSVRVFPSARSTGMPTSPGPSSRSVFPPLESRTLPRPTPTSATPTSTVSFRPRLARMPNPFADPQPSPPQPSSPTSSLLMPMSSPSRPPSPTSSSSPSSRSSSTPTRLDPESTTSTRPVSPPRKSSSRRLRPSLVPFPTRKSEFSPFYAAVIAVSALGSAWERLYDPKLTLDPFSCSIFVNPDCGLKTRGWPEVETSLKNLVNAAKWAREKYADRA